MISAETVTQTLEKMSVITPAEVQKMINLMSKEQPVILAYLLAAGENEEIDENEAQILLFVGVVVWQLLRQSKGGVRKITEKQLEKVEKSNEAQLEKMAADSAGDFFSAAEASAVNCPEPEVLRYILEALMEDEEGNTDNPPFREESLGLAYLHLKNVLDAFIGSRK